MIPDVDERKLRDCDDCIMRCYAYDEEGDPDHICILSEYHFSKCKYNFTESELKEILDQHNSMELPDWLKTKLAETITNCRLLEEELRSDNDGEEAVRVSRRANTLEWVLTLRRD